MIVGMIARADCRGPNVLNGRRIVTGRPNARMIALPERIGPDLGRGVGRLALERVPLVDGNGLGGAVDLGRRRQDQPRQRRACPAGVENVGRPQHVGLNHVVRVVIRVRNRDQGTEVEDPFSPLDRALARRRDPSNRRARPRWRPEYRRAGRQIAAVVASVVTHERPHLVAIPDQPLGQMTADEPPCPRHQDLLTHRRATPLPRLGSLRFSTEFFGRRSYGISAFFATSNETRNNSAAKIHGSGLELIPMSNESCQSLCDRPVTDGAVECIGR